MTDIYTKQKRSQIMQRITGSDTKCEILVRQFLFAHGYRFRKNDERYPGKPDIVLPKYKTIIFINGCFWHGHKNCKKAKLPFTNYSFWSDKVKKNIQRDLKNYKDLRRLGFNVLILWECKLKEKKSREVTLMKLLKKLNR